LQPTELRERESGGGRRSVEIGRKKLLVLVGSYCVRWEALLITALVGKQNSCGLTHGEREREREREALKSPESLGSSIEGI